MPKTDPVPQKDMCKLMSYTHIVENVVILKSQTCTHCVCNLIRKNASRNAANCFVFKLQKSYSFFRRKEKLK